MYRHRTIENVLEMLIIELEATHNLRMQLKDAMDAKVNFIDAGKIGLRLAGIHDALGASIPEYIENINTIKSSFNNVTIIDFKAKTKKAA